MTLSVVHPKVDTIADWTQAELDAQIALGNYPPGTVLADIVLPSDWNNAHTVSGTLAASSVDVQFDNFLKAGTAQDTLSVLARNVRGLVLVFMGNADYTLSVTEAMNGVLVIVGSGDGTKTLTIPTTSDDTVVSSLILYNAFSGGNPYYLQSQTGGAAIQISAPYFDVVGYNAGSSPISFYNGNFSNAAFDTSWLNSLVAPTKNAVYGAINSVNDISFANTFMMMGA